MALNLDTLPHSELATYCKTNSIRRLAVFGSALRDDFGANSDVDILVEFEPGKAPGLAFFRMQDELASLIGRRVDLQTPGFLSPHFRDQVLSQAKDVYVAA